MYDLWWQQDSRRHIRFSTIWSHPNEPQKTFDGENKARNDEPLPEVWTMENDQEPEGNVHQMSPVKDFKASAATNKRKWTNKHHRENCNKQKACRVRPAADESKKLWSWSEEKLTEREVLRVDDSIVNDDKACAVSLISKSLTWKLKTSY